MANVKITVTTEDGEILDSTEVPWEEFEAADWVGELHIGAEVQPEVARRPKKVERYEPDHCPSCHGKQYQHFRNCPVYGRG